MALRRAVRRETLREADFLWTTRFWAERISTGCAAASAALAAPLSPEAIASSTLRTYDFSCEDRDLLTAVRRMAWRAAFVADLVLAIAMGLLLADWALAGRLVPKRRVPGLFKPAPDKTSTSSVVGQVSGE